VPFTASLGVEVDLTLIPADQLLAAQHALVEKVLPLPFDVLVHAWIDLSSDAPPAFMHSQFFHSTGAFRAGPRSRSSTNCWGGPPPPPTSAS
jgi:peptide/nickel transport system substrate-binding protein